jgi:hypothetical protein
MFGGSSTLGPSNDFAEMQRAVTVEETLAWMSSAMAVRNKKKQPFVVVAAHRPLFANTDDRTMFEDDATKLATVLNVGGVQLMVSGHVHGYTRCRFNQYLTNTAQIVVAAGGCTMNRNYKMAGNLDIEVQNHDAYGFAIAEFIRQDSADKEFIRWSYYETSTVEVDTVARSWEGGKNRSDQTCFLLNTDGKSAIADCGILPFLGDGWSKEKHDCDTGPPSDESIVNSQSMIFLWQPWQTAVVVTMAVLVLVCFALILGEVSPTAATTWVLSALIGSGMLTILLVSVLPGRV